MTCRLPFFCISLFFFTCCTLLLLLSLPVSVQAHRITVFAWVEGNTVYGEASFSSNRNAVNVPVSVCNAESKHELLSLRTSNTGKFSFQITENMQENHLDLLLVVNTGEGHRGEWLLPANEYLAGADTLPQTPQKNVSSKPLPSPPLSSSLPAQDSRIRQLIDQELEKKLAPLRKQIAALKNPEPQLRDVLAGLGCIMGLAGIIAWLQSRKKNEQQ